MAYPSLIQFDENYVNSIKFNQIYGSLAKFRLV